MVTLYPDCWVLVLMQRSCPVSCFTWLGITHERTSCTSCWDLLSSSSPNRMQSKRHKHVWYRHKWYRHKWYPPRYQVKSSRNVQAFLISSLLRPLISDMSCHSLGKYGNKLLRSDGMRAVFQMVVMVVVTGSNDDWAPLSLAVPCSKRVSNISSVGLSCGGWVGLSSYTG